MAATGEREAVGFRPVITEPTPQTPKQKDRLLFPGDDLAVEALLTLGGVAPRLLTSVAKAPARQQLCYQAYSSKSCCLSHEQCPDCARIQNVIRQAVLDEVMTYGVHVPAANNIESLQIPEDMSGQDVNGSEAALDSDLDNGITLNKQRDQNPEERKTATSPNKRLASVELPLVGGKRARVTEPDRSLNPAARADVPNSSRKRTQKPYASTKTKGVQNWPGVNRSRIPGWRRRVIADDTDDDEDKMRMTDDEEEKILVKKDEEETLQMLSDDEEELPALIENQNGDTRRRSRRIMERDARRRFWDARRKFRDVYLQEEDEDDGWDYEQSSDVE